jgi:hypothetical protein
LIAILEIIEKQKEPRFDVLALSVKAVSKFKS